MFEGINTRSILDQVPSKMKDTAARSLWKRIDSEFASDGPRRVSSYLRSRFDEISTRLRADLADVKDAGSV